MFKSLDTLTMYNGNIDLENYKEFYYFPLKVNVKHQQPDFNPKLDLYKAQIRLIITENNEEDNHAKGSNWDEVKG